DITFEQAAAIPIAGLTALQALRDHAQLKPGNTVLINGAAGGVGTFAVQIAKALGASRVVAVCSGRNAELVSSLGADKCVDYTTEDFSALPERFDVILDVVGGVSYRKFRRLMNPGGTLVVVGAGHQNGHSNVNMPRTLARIAVMALRGRVLRQRVRFFIAA